MSNSVFKQVIQSDVFVVSIPQKRIESIINRVDTAIEKRRFKKARQIIAPFILNEGALVAEKPVALSADQIVEKYRSQGRKVVIEQLVAAGSTRPSAYYRVKKAGL